jgi:hypothetical protein
MTLVGNLPTSINDVGGKLTTDIFVTCGKLIAGVDDTSEQQYQQSRIAYTFTVLKN